MGPDGITGPTGPAGLAGPTGFTGPVGPTGPGVDFSRDFAYIYSTSTHNISISGYVPFTNIITSPTSSISLDSTKVTISDAGFFQITVGISTLGGYGNTNSNFGITSAIGSMSPTTVATLHTQSAYNNLSYSTITLILNVLQTTVLELQNISGDSRKLNVGTGVGPSAFVTIIKLSN